MITAFPKIFHLGADYIGRIFDNEVEVTEKIDGSQFIFGKIDGELLMRSKGTMIHDYRDRAENDLFYPVIQHVMELDEQGQLPDGLVFYGETLCRPKHNTLKYERVPKNNFALFGVSTLAKSFEQDHDTLKAYAERLDVDVVPLLYRGWIETAEDIKQFLDKPSVLGGVNAEGVVVKNYQQPFLLGGQPIPVMAGKYVTEAFKEVHRGTWAKENTGAGKWATFKEGYKTEARWEKAVQHLRESNDLEDSPRDIGKLIAEVKRDIAEEEREIIKQFLWNHFGKDVLRVAVAGLPEWYKQKLLDRSFEDA
ncbi:MAG: RNA ligase family protein [Candidatus Thorarchaeota archaeon]|jgi:hypothetical protein